MREPIKEMLAGGSEEDFKDSLPEQTSSEDQQLSPEQSKPRKKRRTKEEMARERGDAGAAPVDKRLERARSKAAGLGGSKLVQSGFSLAGKPLNDEETEDLDDQFYLIANKAGIDPSGSWTFVILYTIALIARLVMSRTDLGEQLRALFIPKEEKDAKEIQESEAQPQ